MKKLILFSAAATIMLASFNQEEINLKFDEIAKQRVTVSNDSIDSIDNPIFVPSESIGDSSGLRLQALVQDRAKINGKWYKRGEDITDAFKLISIRNDAVLLKASGTYKELKLQDKKDKNVTIFKK